MSFQYPDTSVKRRVNAKQTNEVRYKQMTIDFSDAVTGVFLKSNQWHEIDKISDVLKIGDVHEFLIRFCHGQVVDKVSEVPTAVVVNELVVQE